MTAEHATKVYDVLASSTGDSKERNLLATHWFVNHFRLICPSLDDILLLRCLISYKCLILSVYSKKSQCLVTYLGGYVNSWPDETPLNGPEYPDLPAQDLCRC